MRWQDKLTKEERKHVQEWGGRTLTGFKRNRNFQRRQREQNARDGYLNTEPCFVCARIAGKLGLKE